PFTPQRISIDDYASTWVFPTAAVHQGTTSSTTSAEEQLPLTGTSTTLTLLLSGPPPATGVISYHHDPAGFAPTWRYTLPT
ncbi:hypothetical protein, partial [Kineococcus indalonis]|uniref:hypothetical protein n=1 Tax=Kineococcus indalonis TaxID=2696566 RepID=UPI00141258F8